MAVPKPPHILVVEDEYLLADDLRTSLEAEGIVVLGPVCDEKDALALLDGGVDGAILDINLDGRAVYPLARTLQQRGVPFIFLTGYDRVDEASGFTDVELLQKPATRQALNDALSRLTKRTMQS